MSISLLDAYLEGKPALTLEEFTRQYEQGINYYFVAHAPPKRRWFRRRG